MVGRESGEVCHASCFEEAYETCTCNLIPQHLGPLHWCFGAKGTSMEHKPHSWTIQGAEVSYKEIHSGTVQCPSCKSVFSAATARRGLAVNVKEDPIITDPGPPTMIRTEVPSGP